ncbi:MAG: DEAD/DEAH box helicase, partial [Saprospiraceae bacterium]
MLSLLARFLRAAPEAQNRILGLLEPRLQPLDTTSAVQQHPLVTRALSARDYFLIQGPPGTGKTSTVLMELARALDAQGLNVMIIAFTNQAIHIICEKLQKLGIEFIQLGRQDTPYSWKTLSEQHPLNKLYEEAARTRIFVSTQATFANSLELLEFKKFHTLIVDEASQLLEPQLAGILPKFERFILIGDDNQLPAVVLQDETISRCRRPQLAEIGLRNLRDSLFTRLLQNARARGWDHCYGMLTKHYRMHADIADYPNRHFYGGLLQPALPDQQAPVAWPPSAHPLHTYFQQRVAYIRTQPDPRSKINDEEAELVVELIRYVHQLYGAQFNPAATVGVITPFRAQIANIRQKLPTEYQDVTI